MSQQIPTVSFKDNLAFNLRHVLPTFLQGIFTRNPKWVAFWTRCNPDAASVRFVHGLQKKYKSDYLYLRMLTTPSLLVLDHTGIRQVLDRSPLVYADARLKREGMSHFMPGAVTISRGEEWKERRRFNEGVLDTGHGLHRNADFFLEVVRDEIGARRQQSGPPESWDDFADLFQKISLQVLFGRAAREDDALMETLKKMLRESNRAVGLKKSRHFDAFYERLRGYIRRPPEDGSLVARCAHVPSTPATRVENQIPHWMFAMNETLATNTARALALIVSHPEAEKRVRAEMAKADLSSAAGIDKLKYLEGCVQEAMRLWPTTPWLVRETVAEDTLGGERIPAKTQVVLLNSFNHRDRKAFSWADTFSPEQWLNNNGVDYRFNHLSNGPQGCAGKEVTLFLAKAVLAGLLRQDRYTLRGPALDPGKPLPYAYNYFAIRFDTSPA